MKTIFVKVNLLTFEELTEKAKEKAIKEHREFQLSIMSPNNFVSGEAEYDTPEKLQETYEAEYDYYLMNDEPIIESIEANEYLFFETGEMADVTQYCGKHEKAGITEFNFMDQVYTI